MKAQEGPRKILEPSHLVRPPEVPPTQTVRAPHRGVCVLPPPGPVRAAIVADRRSLPEITYKPLTVRG